MTELQRYLVKAIADLDMGESISNTFIMVVKFVSGFIVMSGEKFWIFEKTSDTQRFVTRIFEGTLEE